MYAYLFDALLQQSRWQGVADRIETKTAELGIAGHAHHLSILKSVGDVVESELRQGTMTIVAVGSEALLQQAITAVAGTTVTLGYIPIGGRGPIARSCGIPEGVTAAAVIANRIVQTVDLGKVQAHYFFDYIRLPNQGLRLQCDGNFSVSFPGSISEVYICKGVVPVAGAAAYPTDGRLRLVVSGAAGGGFFSRTARPTVLLAKKISARAREPVDVMHGEKKLSSTPADITVVPRALRMIMGKDREVCL